MDPELWNNFISNQGLASPVMRGDALNLGSIFRTD